MQGSPLSVRENIQRGPEAAAARKRRKTHTSVWEMYSESMLIANVCLINCILRRLMITSQVRPAIKAHAGIELMNELPIAIMLNVLARFTPCNGHFMQTTQN